MVCNYSELANNVKQWAQQAVAQQWLDSTDVAALLELDARSPDSLFANPTASLNSQVIARPLIAAFMGGTGVGKSSLLNRLAGQAIAKAGIERPTSREVTLYHHESITIAQLPDNLPLTSIKIAQHQNADKKNTLWIDMPDFDSTEQRNKNLVLQWLPHIDVLIYVVSPERYRDHKAWQILLAEGAKHGWLFVLNQWDKGQELQYDDFKQQLSKAGFAQPLIFRSDCSQTLPDEFELLLSTLTTLATEHAVQQLAQRNLRVKKDQLKHHLHDCAMALEDFSAYPALLNSWQQQWKNQEILLKQSFTFELQQYANRYARSGADVMVKARPLFLWDEWAQNRLNDSLNELVANAEQLKIPALPLKTRLLAVQNPVQEAVHQQTELECRLALSQPGNRFQRGLLKCAAVAEILLPFLALSWVAYQVFHGYYQSSVGTRAYLGVDFVAHSGLLVLVSWLLPYFISKKMQPSLEKTALRGLNKGLDLALATIDSKVQQAITDHQAQQQRLLAQAQHYLVECKADVELAQIEKNSLLAQMLVD